MLKFQTTAVFEFQMAIKRSVLTHWLNKICTKITGLLIFSLNMWHIQKFRVKSFQVNRLREDTYFSTLKAGVENSNRDFQALPFPRKNVVLIVTVVWTSPALPT